jgi:hypothetical protein
MKPDFSGEWILDRQACTLSASAAGFQSGVMRIDHREPIYQFQIRMVADDKPVEYAFECRSDGQGVAEEGSVTSLSWDGDALVFRGRSKSPDGPWTISFSLRAAGAG